MTQTGAAWRSEKKTRITSMRSVDLAVELAKRISREMLVSSAFDSPSAVSSDVHGLLLFDKMHLTDDTWQPSNQRPLYKTGPYALECGRPFSSKSNKKSIEEKRQSLPNKHVRNKRIVSSVAKPVKKGVDKSKLQSSSFDQGLSGVAIAESHRLGPAACRNFIEKHDPYFDALFRPSSETKKGRYSYPDPLPEDFNSFHGNTLRKMQYFRNDPYAFKLTELQKQVNATLEWESPSSTQAKTAKEKELLCQDKLSAKDIRKTKSFESVATEKGIIKTKSLDDMTAVRSASRIRHSCFASPLAAPSNDTSEIVKFSKDCWNDKADTTNSCKTTNPRERSNSGKHILKTYSEIKNGYGKPNKIEEGQSRLDHDPARVFRNSGMKKYLALQKSYWEAQIRSSQKKKLVSTSGKVSNVRRSQSRNITDRDIDKRDIHSVLQHNEVTSRRSSLYENSEIDTSGDSFAASGKSCQIHRPARSKSAIHHATHRTITDSCSHSTSNQRMKKRANSVIGLCKCKNLQPGKSFHSQRRTSLTKARRQKSVVSATRKQRPVSSMR